jgi:CRISPR-associated endonuclease/helicase Cas3
MKPPISSFWAKLESDPGGHILGWHPLEDHSADVAACTKALLELDVFRRRLARLGGCDDLSPGQVARLAALAALHDLGKFNIGFQNRAWQGRMPQNGHVGPLFALLGSSFRLNQDLCSGFPRARGDEPTSESVQ